MTTRAITSLIQPMVPASLSIEAMFEAIEGNSKTINGDTNGAGYIVHYSLFRDCFSFGHKRTGACHAFLNGLPRSCTALVVNSNSSDYDGLDEETYAKFFEFMVNRGPFNEMILSKDVEFVRKNGFVLNPNVPSNVLAGCCFSLRQHWENGRIAKVFLRMRDELGIDEWLAYSLASHFNCEPQGSTKLMLQHGHDYHGAFTYHSSTGSPDGFINFYHRRISATKVNPNWNGRESGSYSRPYGVQEMWSDVRRGSDLFPWFTELLNSKEEAGPEGFNPFQSSIDHIRTEEKKRLAKDNTVSFLVDLTKNPFTRLFEVLKEKE